MALHQICCVTAERRNAAKSRVLEASPAVIDGGTRVVGWAPSAAVVGALVAPLPPKIAASAPLRQLWVGGRRATRPREYVVQWQRGGDGKPPPSLILNSSVINITSTPNASVPFSGLWLGYDFAAGGPVKPSAWANPSDVEFVFRSSQPWIEPRCTVARIDGSAVYLKQPCLGDLSQRERGPDKSANRPMLPPYYIENVLTNLTQPGQWYYHRANASIIYMPRPGETAASVAASAFVSTEETILLVNGSHNMAWEGVRFQHATWDQPSTARGYVDWQAGTSGGIYVRRA